MKLPIDSKTIGAVIVGAFDIYFRTKDESAGTTSGKFLSTTTDKARLAVTGLALVGNMFVQEARVKKATEGMLLGAIPLLELSLYRGFVAAGGSTPFFLQQPRVQAVQGASYASANPQGFVELAANGGLPIVTTGVSIVNSGNGRLY